MNAIFDIGMFFVGLKLDFIKFIAKIKGLDLYDGSWAESSAENSVDIEVTTEAAKVAENLRHPRLVLLQRQHFNHIGLS